MVAVDGGTVARNGVVHAYPELDRVGSSSLPAGPPAGVRRVLPPGSPVVRLTRTADPAGVDDRMMDVATFVLYHWLPGRHRLPHALLHVAHPIG
jgi:hypothetical protein